ncbi:MAG: GNAT family N-acetyltransferase [Beijerinckiaceae bacterium]|nr:MAG: GNAT family N-acetyltransferase [Beijerinckiaceae bacterium]
MREPSPSQESAPTSVISEPQGGEPRTPLTVECLGLSQAEVYIDAWRKLAETCAEPNVFLDPDFALPAARYLTKAPRFLFVWDGNDEKRGLVGLCPLAHPGPGEGFFPERLWTHNQAPLGTPLLDAGHAKDALDAIFAWCLKHFGTGAGLIFPMLPQEGVVAGLLRKGAAAEGREILTLDAGKRACLSGGQEPQQYLDASIHSNRRRKLKRARKLLEARGILTFQVATAPEDVRAATESFLDLEAKGWKGRRGTAFLKSTEGAAFAREVATKLAAGGKYMVVSLTLNAQALAVGLVLKSGNRAFWWKIAYDEVFAHYSPGVLLASEGTRFLLSDATIALTDSCTQGAYSMIEHIWSERMGIADVLAAVGAAHPEKFDVLARRERLRRTLRSRLKAVVLWLRQWKRGRAHAQG